MFNKILACLYLTLIPALHAQNEIDALRYSLLSNENTAGISALGGAGGLLSHSYNPASLAFFSGNNLLSISIGNKSNYTETNYLSHLSQLEKTQNATTNLIPFIQNAGYVASLQFSETEEWSTLNIALSVNRKQNFNQNTTIKGHNSKSSMLNQFVDNAQNIAPDDLGWNEWIAYNSFLIDPEYTIEGNDTVWTGNYIPTGNAIIGQNQTKKISESGLVNEVDLAFSSSYKDWIFLGGSIGFTQIKYSYQSIYIEDEFNEENNLLSFQNNEYLFQEGGGINLKFGAILKPLPFLRIGCTYHSPTYNEISEFYENSIETNFKESPDLEVTTDLVFTEQYSSEYKFTLNTPAKSISSLALIGKYKKLRALMTVDLERINYGSAKLATIDYYSNPFDTANENINQYYGVAYNKKIGLLFSLENISIRGGYAMFGSPFESKNLNDWHQEYISFGLGYKIDSYSFDIAIAKKSHNEDYILYNDFDLPNPSQEAKINSNTNTFIITCSYKF